MNRLHEYMWRKYGSPIIGTAQDFENAGFALAFAFGQGKDDDQKSRRSSCLSNQDIAKIMDDLRRKYPQLKIAAQWEVAYLMQEPVDFVIEQHRELQKNGEPKYLDTEEVAYQFLEWVVRQNAPLTLNGQSKVVVVAQDQHWARCGEVMKKKGLSPIAPSNLGSIQCDPDSRQVWTQSRRVFQTYELVARRKYAMWGYTNDPVRVIALRLLLGVSLTLAFVAVIVVYALQ